MTPLRSLAWLTVLLPALVPVTGCARVCPATPEACSRATERPAQQTVYPSATAAPTGANGLGFPPGGGPVVRRIMVEKVGPDTWRFGFEIDSPGSVTVRALDAAGKTLAEKKVRLDWQRVGGTVGCGGPETAAPVTLRLSPH